MPELNILIALGLTLAGVPLALLYSWKFGKRGPDLIPFSWLLALLPLTSFVLLLSATPTILHGESYTWSVPWVPSTGLTLSLAFDGLSALFALIVTGIGALIVVYTGYYFKGDRSAWRFHAYQFLFMFSMLGLVLSGDVLALFIFWEGTSIVSFLLIAYNYRSEAARQGATKALYITGGGGIVLFIGLIIISVTAGSTELAAILRSGETLRESSLYLLMLILVAAGAFTKSAQFPFHNWLPGAMRAPTPASAFLHSATMVNAGIYLLARLNPVLGLTEPWFWLLSLVGMATMLTGAYLGLRHNDLKAILAYSTILQLGILVMLAGQDTDIAFKGLVIGTLAHALYKSALFMIAGIVDRSTGTRDISHLGGLRALLPGAFAVAFVAGLSMAGLPPLFGFLAKETLLATAVHPSLPFYVSWVFAGAVVIAAAFKLVQAGMAVGGPFLGKPRDRNVHAGKVPLPMIIAAGIPALVSLLVGAAPEPAGMAELLAAGATNAYGSTVKVSLAIWTGLNVPFALSMVAIALGFTLYHFRRVVVGWVRDHTSPLNTDAFYQEVLSVTERAAGMATRLQGGRLRDYLVIMILTLVLLSATLLLAAGASQPAALSLSAAEIFRDMSVLRLLALFVTVGAVMASIVLKRDFFAILAFSTSGLAIAVYMILEPAPDVALVQLVVDMLSTVILVLALIRLPRRERRSAQRLFGEQSAAARARNIVTAVTFGLLTAFLSWSLLSSRPRLSYVSPFYEANAKLMAGAKDIVGAIIVDFRAFDTLIEIAVFTVAGLSVYTLFRYVGATFRDPYRQEDSPHPSRFRPITLGIGGERTSFLIRAVTTTTLPAAMIIAATHLMYGHDQPGDGFTAGVIISLAIGLWYVIFGYEETRRRLKWLKPIPLVAAGLLLELLNGAVAYAARGHFLGHVEYSGAIAALLPSGFTISSAFVFELSICLVVLGSATTMLNTLGRPVDPVGTEAMRAAAGEE